jgi:2'-hydroxyisoflavone reductase
MTVTTVRRGTSGVGAAGVRELIADRTEPGSLAAALGDETWDVAIDTWSHAPRVVADSAALLSGRVGHYTYVSSRSVYAWPIPLGADETAPLVDGDPDDTNSSDYARAKRGGELAVERGFDGPSAVLRAGLILGPWEDVGRLPFWLRRIARGGPVPVPGPPELPLQYIDARDLARFALHRPVGTFNTVSPTGHTTMGELIEAVIRATGSTATIRWCTAEQVEAAGVAPWTELPIWLPGDGELSAMHRGDVSAAVAAGLTCRPISDTVIDTWAWLNGPEQPGALGTARGGTGMDAAAEARLLATIDD